MNDRSRLGDLIVMHGPYVEYELIPNPVTRYLESTELNALRDELIKLRDVANKAEDVTTSQDWRVTGTPRLLSQSWEFPDEDKARRFIANAPCAWTDGPHLHKRTVTVTDWEDA